MKARRTLFGTAVAKAVLEALAGKPRTKRVWYDDNQSHVTAWRTEVGTLRVIAEIRAPEYTHHNVKANRARTYIHAKNELASLDRFITKLCFAWKGARPIHDARERLYQLAESRVIPDSWCDNPPVPNTMVYDQMSFKDISVWWDLVQQLSMKGQP